MQVRSAPVCQATCTWLHMMHNTDVPAVLQDFLGLTMMQRWDALGGGVPERDEALQPWRRGLEVARAAGSDVWTAHLALLVSECGVLVSAAGVAECVEALLRRGCGSHVQTVSVHRSRPGHRVPQSQAALPGLCMCRLPP